MIKFNLTFGSAGYIKTLLGKTLLGVLFIFLFVSCSSSPSDPGGDKEEALKISFQESSLTKAEGEDFAFILEINATNEQNISFDWNIEHVTTDNDDFIGATKDSGIIAAGRTTTIITITTSNDSIFEGNENFKLNITNISGATPTSPTATGTITDNLDDPRIVLFILNPRIILKEGSSAKIRVSLQKIATGDVNFNWKLQGGSDDFIKDASTAIITAGSTTTDIIIDASRDDIYETTEDFKFTISSDAPHTTIRNFAIISIDDRDDIPSISIKDASANENDETINFELTLSNLSRVAIPFSWSTNNLPTANSLAIENSDFRLTTTKGYFAAGSLDASFDIVIIDDEIYESDETFGVTITNGVNNDTTSAIATIKDSGDFPTIFFQEPSLAKEEGVDFVWIVQLSNQSEQDVSFDWSISNITTSNDDFSGATKGSNIIAALSTQASITIATSNDSTFESNESFRLNITSISGATADNLQATGIITDDLDSDDIVLFISNQKIIVNEGSPTTVIVSLNKAATYAIDFSWQLQGGSDDFIKDASTANIATGDTTINIIIDTSNDNIYEATEDFEFTISSDTRDTTVSARNFATISIDDRDDIPSISIKDASANENDETINFELTLSNLSRVAIPFSWSATNNLPTANSLAIENSDFRLTTTKGYFAAGSLDASFDIVIIDDEIYESDETFGVTITNGVNNDTTSAIATIKDSGDFPTIFFQEPSLAKEEGVDFVWIVQLSNQSEQDVSFDWSISNITTSNDDFSDATKGSGSIAALSTQASITIATSNDSIFESNESFRLNITSISGAILDNRQATGTITDELDKPTIFFATNNINEVAEGESFAWIVRLSNQTKQNVSFDWSISNITTSNDDFLDATKGSNIIVAGSDTTSITIKTSSNDIFESNESFEINITNINIVNSRGTTLDNRQATGTITDEEDKPTISLSAIDTTIDEGSAFTWIVRLSNQTKQDVSFDWSISNITTSNDDFKGATKDSGSIAAGRITTNIIIETSNDSIVESDESFEIKITNINILNSGGVTLDNRQATGIITDEEDKPTIFFATNNINEVAEGDSFTWSLQLSKQIKQDVSFEWSIAHRTTSNDDFAGTAAAGSITAGSTTTDIIITIIDDDIFELNESFEIKITNIKILNSRGVTLDNLQETITITDEEDRPTISLGADFTTISEGDSFTWSLQLSKRAKQDISFRWNIDHGTTDNDDFIDATGSGSITAGSLETSIAIETSNDIIPESDESFSLNITNISLATPDNLKIAKIIITDDLDNLNTLLFIPNQKIILNEGSSAKIRVNLNKASSNSVNFSWQLQDGSNDFINATGSGSIAINSITTDIVINTKEDNIYEVTEYFEFTISSDTSLSTMKSTQISIIDDINDIPSISINEASADENDGAINFELTLSNPSSIAIPFSWYIVATNSDFAQTSGTGEIDANLLKASFDVVIIDDEIYELDETFTITITNGVNNEATSAIATIKDNGDFPTIDFQEPSLTRAEGVDFVWVVQLSNQSEQDVSFDWSVSNITTSNDDFRDATKGSGIITAGSPQTRITIKTNDDSTFEKNENFILNITSISGATPDNLQATGTIAGDDKKLINIGTAQELSNIRYNLAGTSYKTSLDDTGVNCDGNDCEGYELTRNIDLSSFNGGNWNPIRGDTSFTSTLKGNGYSISGLNINEPTTNHVGLFSRLDARIDNLIIKVKTIKGNKFVGALAGSSSNSMLDNIQIRKTDANSMLQTNGGNAGALIGDAYKGVITNAFSDLNIIATNDSDNIGGLVGYMWSTSKISYSSASGNLQGSGEQYGGLVGRMQDDAKISYSSASGKLQGSGNKHGGLVGYMTEKSQINYSSASGNLQGGGIEYGGLVGRMDTAAKISYSSASGNLQGDGEQYGGLVGIIYSISTIISHSSASGSVRGSSNIGSFLGKDAHSNALNIEYSYSLGTALGGHAIGFVGSSIESKDNNYLNSETSKITAIKVSVSDTASMLTSSGGADDTAFSTWSSQTNADGEIWNFVDASSYPVLRGRDATSQAINLAYGLLRLASGNNADSFLGGTLINEEITLSVTGLPSDFAILDVNLRASNDTSRRDFFDCKLGTKNSDTTLVSNSINGTIVELSINKPDTSDDLDNALIFNNNNCSVSFDTVTPTSGNQLRLDAKVSKGKVSQTKVFIINFVD